VFGTGPGVLAAIVGGVGATYYLLPPFYSLALPPPTILALVFYTLIVGVDISLMRWLQMSNASLLEQRHHNLDLLAHREVLFSELQHRVGNNLQMISSLIALQKRQLTDEAARAALDEAARRLGLVGRIHRQLYDPAGAQLGLAAYIDQISRDVIAASGCEDVTYEFKAEVDAELSADQAIPTALVVAEAINNAIEHGFGAGGCGHVAVRVSSSEGGVSVVIADDGTGLPEGFDLETSNSLGLRIARTLAQSLGGRFSMVASPLGRGTIAQLDIRLADAPRPVAA